ncbi:hypothetical protein [Caproiciproducens galactitolivorans]|uniref:Uncharacterized protein n=1 Tax=Caproiciproducens galactitolivorans TaxID=642589 RepID=A0A4Z0YJH9_9FIRM|nr:hypothetical protein [Caproiciproducens galactitolivorans]TGJ77022.1 hypothetical protein CAGA_10970 [Caproiciproducens galactitolivorans]
MVDYKEMYTILFNKVTDIIEELKQVQCKTEEMYIQSREAEILQMKQELEIIKKRNF